MVKRFLLISISLILIVFLTSACYSEAKMVKRDIFGTATLTPFLPKATFTKVSPPIQGNTSTDSKNDDPSPTETEEPTSTEQISEVTITGEPSPTASVTLTPELNSPTIYATGTIEPSTATIQIGLPSSTTTPNEPSATAKPLQSSATATLSIPSHTPNPPPATNTSIPPTATEVSAATLTPEGCSFSGNNTYENQVVTLINQERTNRGLPALSNNSSLRLAARRHSEDMACNDFFSHTGSDGSTLSTRLIAAGYSYTWAAENIAASSSSSFSAQSVVSMWMNSSGHKANILSENVTQIGVGFRYAGDSNTHDYDAYYTADFGRP